MSKREGFGLPLAQVLRKVQDRVLDTPLGAYAQEQYERAETRVLMELRARLENLEASGAQQALPGAGAESGEGHAHGDQALPPFVHRFTQLLEHALEQSYDDAETALFESLVSQMVADEARIVAALSDGQPHALLHVIAGRRVGLSSRRVRQNLSPIGRAAGVKLLDEVPYYIGHLRALGLLSTGPEDSSLEMAYQIVEGSSAVMDLERSLGVPVRTQRRTVLLSDLGQRLWRAVTRQPVQQLSKQDA